MDYKRNNEDIHQFIYRYMNEYYPQRYKRKHPGISKKQWYIVYDNLLNAYQECCYGIEILDEMAIEFFNTVKKSDWNINHFASKGILNILEMRVTK